MDEVKVFFFFFFLAMKSRSCMHSDTSKGLVLLQRWVLNREEENIPKTSSK